MKTPRLGLIACNIGIIASLILIATSTYGDAIVVGIVPLSVASSVNNLIPIKAASYFVMTIGEATIFFTMTLFMGLHFLLMFSKDRKEILKELDINREILDSSAIPIN